MKQLNNLNYLWLFLGFIVLVFSRFYNIERNFKFNRDESSDLVKMHQYWVDKKISLIGPISEDGNLVYSSLSYYLVMPAAIIFGFRAVSPTLGNAFWSVITCLLMVYWLYKVNRKIDFLDFVLIVTWYPLLIISRWAWNPNLIPLMMILGLILVETKKWWLKFLGGFFFGLAGHMHYLSLVPGAIYGLLKHRSVWFYLGFSIPVGIFVLFDLTHLPGLFITRAFLFKQGQLGINLSAAKVCFEYLTGSWLSLLFVCLLLIKDIKDRKKVMPYWFSVAGLIVVVCFLKKPEAHYFNAAIIPFWAWVSLKREGRANILKKVVISSLVLFSLLNSYNIVFGNIPDDSSFSAQQISEKIAKNIRDDKLVNANLAVLQSSDINSFGLKYRDLLLTSNTDIKDKDSFQTSDNLFVITQTASIDELRKDRSVQMSYFMSGPVKLISQIQGTNWWVFRFDRY